MVAPVRKRLTSFFILVLSLFFFSSLVHAEILDQLARDFSSISGYVVKKCDGQFIIDLDTSDGIIQGDIFSVVSSGEKLVHPVTGEIIGSLKQVKGILKVVRVKTGFSFTRPLLGENEIHAGDSIQRYEDITAVFWDYTEDGRNFFHRLQNKVPSLKWSGYDQAQQFRPQKPGPVPETGTAIVFILAGDTLNVRGPEFMLLHTYKLSEIPATDTTTSRFTPMPESSPTEISPSFHEERPSASDMPLEPKWDRSAGSAEPAEPVFAGVNFVEKLSGPPSIMADFISYDNELLLATTDGYKIDVFNIKNGMVPVAKGDTEIRGKILWLSWWQPDPSRKPFLAVVNWVDNSPSGTLFELHNDTLKPLGDRISMFIGAFDIDGDDSPETLLGQRYDPEEFFGHRIRELKWTGGEFKDQKPPVKLPRRFTVSGSLIGDLTGDSVPESAFIRDNILYIYSGKEAIYKSSRIMGGTLSTLLYEVNPGTKDPMTNSIAIEIPPIRTDLVGNNIPELIAVASKQSALSYTGIDPGIEKSWLTVLKYENGQFTEGTLGDEIKSPIQGLEIYGGQVLMLTSKTGSVLSQGGSSRLIALPLKHGGR